MKLRHRGGVSPVLIAGLVVVLVGGGVTALLVRKQSSVSSTTVATVSPTPKGSATATATTTSDAEQAGRQLSGNKCTGTGTKPLGSPPMKLTDIGIIQPYGLMVGGHVTPVDHQYYYPKDFTAGFRDTASVLAPADGVITEISHRGDKMNTPLGAKDIPSSDEYRFVITYSCTFFSYVDLVTSLDDSVKSHLPSDWGNNNYGTDIPVKQGQVIGKVGGQSLDFAVWDTTKVLPGLLVQAAYDNAEMWKAHTVKPLDFFTDTVKAGVLPFYERTAEPIDGKLDYDIDGKLVGTWFQQGTNGYAGSTSPGLTTGYWTGHLTFAYNYLDPAAIEVSIGNYPGGADQFAAKRSSTDPATVGVDTGLVKYELGALSYVTPSGSRWDFQTVIHGVTLQDVTTVKATVLAQLTDKRTLKMEVFPGKTADQVTAFDANALTYTRGDGATTPRSNTAH